MAKKLVHKYEFFPSENKVKIYYIYKPERLLLISNVTTGDTIYAFNDSEVKINNIEYNFDQETMLLTLNYDCSAMSVDDKLQIFVEEDSLPFEPSETFVDPVSKIRISQPENLIDTDFEYGLQSTKWETLETVRNIPTFFSRTGEADIDIVEISTINGSDYVTVVFLNQHSFAPGTPILVTGTSSITCDGTFVVTTVVDDNTIQYKAKAIQTFTGPIQQAFTQIFPGSVYQGTEFDLTGIEAITTDAETASTLTVTTEFPTGFSLGTSFYLSNSVAQVNALADAELVESENVLTISKTTNNIDPTGESGFSIGAVQPYVYTAAQAIYFRNSEISVNTTANTITFENDHGIPDNTHWMYVSSELNTVIGGLTTYTGYYVRTVSSNEIYFTTTLGGTTRVNLTGAGTDGGVMRSALLRAYRATTTTTTTVTFAQPHGIPTNSNTPVLFFNGTLPTGLATVTSNLHTVTDSTMLRFTRTTGASTSTFATAPNGANITFSTTTATMAMIPVVPLSDSNSIFFGSHGLKDDDIVQFTILAGAVGGLTTNTSYRVEVANEDRIRFKVNNTGALINLTTAGTAVSQYSITSKVPVLTNDSIFVREHGLREGAPVIYDANDNDPIPGLVDQTTYYVFQRTFNNFKLATTSQGWKSAAIEITNQANNVNLSTDVITTATHGFVTGDAVQYRSSTPIGGLVSGAFYWVRAVSATTLTLFWTRDGAIADTAAERVILTPPNVGTGTLRAASLVDITGTSIGTHIFKSVSNSGSDGVYTVSGILGDRTFQLASNNQIPERELIIDPPLNLDLSRSAFYYKDHFFVSGTSVVYNTSDQPIGGLVDDTRYYVIRLNNNWFRLASTKDNAENKVSVTLTSNGSGTHILSTSSISGEVAGPGTVTIAEESSRIIGDGTNFPSVYSPGDEFIIYVPETAISLAVSTITTATNIITTSAAHNLTTGQMVQITATTIPNGLAAEQFYYVRAETTTTVTLHPSPDDAVANTNIVNITSAGSAVSLRVLTNLGDTIETTIKYVNGTTELIAFDNFSQTLSNLQYSVTTALLLRADGFAIHRAFDGGVELTPSKNPDSAMIRQTRRYFRYQSGKGIQVSFAVNFNPPITFDRLFVSRDQEKIDKCRRDLGYFIDGLVYDLTLGTNYNAVFLGRAESNSVDLGPLITEKIDDLRRLIIALPEVSGDAVVLVNDFFTELFDIIDNGAGEASTIVYPITPPGTSDNVVAAKDKLQLNREFLIAEVNAYVAVTYPDTVHSVGKCTRDLDYAIDSIIYDLLYGGNSATYNGANFFLYGYGDGRFGIIPAHIDQTVAAYTHLKNIISDVVTGNLIVNPSEGNVVPQVLSGPNATSAEAEVLEDLIEILVETISTGDVPDITVVYPDISWADQSLQDAKTAITTNKTTLVETAADDSIGFTNATGVTRYPHKLSPGLNIRVSGASESGGTLWNGIRKVVKIIDDFTFKYALPEPAVETQADGLSEFQVLNWDNSLLKCGLFDDQNGLYFEYNGRELFCCRRSSVVQLSGTVSATFKSSEIIGTNTRFSSQLREGDRIVIKGQTYLITKISSNNLLYILPSYRGVSTSNIILTKTVDTKIPQSEWSLDQCDGFGPSGYRLDTSKIQMAYMDYSWYGAGKVRFGFKDQDGKVIYVHEFIHNNKFTEAYMRSGNLPARYEIENTGIPTYVPTLAHWGTSVIMDGRFDDDKAYVFTANSNSVSITGSATLTVSARVESLQQFQVFQDNTWRDVGNALTVATPNPSFNNIPATSLVAGAGIQVGTRTRLPAAFQVTPRQPYLASVQSRFGGNNATIAARTLLAIDRVPTLVAASPSNYTVTLSAAATPVVYEQPLISIRLAPSVDNGTPGVLGQREIINRMQLILDSVGILSTHAAEITLKLNGSLNNNSWQRVTNPSLSQLIYHSSADTINGGTTVFSFRAQGSVGTTNRGSVVTTAELGEIATLGNSILGGDGTYPDGPDVLTVVARLIEDPSTVATTNPFTVAARISWSESQA
jgi:hypothetical protein